MLQREPEAQAPKACHRPLQRVNHLPLLKEQFQCYDADDMLIGNHLTAYCSLCVVLGSSLDAGLVTDHYVRLYFILIFLYGSIISVSSSFQYLHYGCFSWFSQCLSIAISKSLTDFADTASCGRLFQKSVTLLLK